MSSEYGPGAARFNVNTINKLFAKAVYTSNCAFSLLQTDDWLEFFQVLLYILPQRKQLASPLLDEVYKEVKERVEDTWKGASQLGIVADESSNITGDRIGNISVIHKGTSYFWSNTDLEAEDANADTIVAHIKSEALKIARGDLKRLSSLATDTCRFRCSRHLARKRQTEDLARILRPCLGLISFEHSLFQSFSESREEVTLVGAYT